MSDDRSSEQLDDWKEDREPPPAPFTRNLLLGIFVWLALIVSLLFHLSRLFHG